MFPVLAKACTYTSNVPCLSFKGFQSATGRLFYGGKFIFNISSDIGYKNKFE